MNRFFTPPENATPKAKSLFRYATLLMLAAAAALPIDVYLAIKNNVWQVWATMGTLLIIFGTSLTSQRLIRNRKIERAGQVLIYGLMLGILLNQFLIANIGLAMALAVIVFTVEIAPRTTERTEPHIITSFVVALITVLLDSFLPDDYRLVVPALEIFTSVTAVLLVIILGYMTLRSFPEFSLRTKMIVVILTIVLVSVAPLAFLANRSLTANLTESVGNNIYDQANSVSTDIAQIIDREYSFLKILSFDQRVRISVEISNLGEILSQSEIEQLDSQWHDPDKNNLLVAGVLQNTAAPQLRQFQKEFPQNVEVFLTDQQGVLIAATDRTSDYYQADEEWWQVAYREGLYIGPPEYDESSKVTAMIIAVAVQEQGTRDIGGVLRTTVTLDSLAQALGSGLSGQTGQVVVYLQNGQELALVPGADGSTSPVVRKSSLDAEVLSQSKKTKYFEFNYDGTPMLASQSAVAEQLEGTIPETDTAQIQKVRAISDTQMNVVIFQELTEARQSVEAQTRNIVLLTFAILVIATFAALGLAQIISGPIIRLNAVAEKVAAGDLSVQAVVETEDETGMLAGTFNSMTTQLRDLIGTLERRVADRTKALATSAEVSRNLSTIMNERQLIIEVVEQLKAAFDYYHVHIYLVDEASGDLIMAGGTGEVGAAMLGSGHKIPKGKGLVGRAAQTNVPVLVVDTSKDPAWLPNPLLPETKSEAALPISTGDTVLGILDVQDDEINGLTIEDFRLLQSLTSQIAIALLNARSYASVHERAEREARITSIGLKIKSTTSIEGALQITARELGRALSTEDIRVILEAPGSVKDPEELN